MLTDRRHVYKHTGKTNISFVKEMRLYTDMYNIACYRIQTALEKEFLKRRKRLLII